MTDPLQAAADALNLEIDRRLNKLLHLPEDVAAAVIRAYLDALNGTVEARAALSARLRDQAGELYGMNDVIRAIRPGDGTP